MTCCITNRRSSAHSLRTKPTREQEIKNANTSARFMLCNSEYHKDDPVQTPVISRGLEGDSEPNPGENLEVKRQLESGQTMQVHQSCDPKPSRKSEEMTLPESSQTEKGLFESSHKFYVEQDGASDEMSEVEQTRGSVERKRLSETSEMIDTGASKIVRQT